MALRQRVVVVVALGAALAVLARTVDLVANDDRAVWVVRTPSTERTVTVPGDSTYVRSAVIWLTAVAVWGAIAVWLLRRRD